MPIKKDENSGIETIELNIKDLPDLPAGAKMSAADIKRRVEKGKTAKVKKNGDGTTTIKAGNTEIELQPNAGAQEIAASVAMISAPVAEVPKGGKTKKEKKPKEPKPRKERKYGRFPSSIIKHIDVNDMREAIKTLPLATPRQLWVEMDDEKNLLNDYIGVEVGGQVVHVPSKDYQIVQFEEAFTPFLDVLAKHHDTSTILGGMTNNRKKAALFVAFPDKFGYVDPTGKKFDLGIIASTSHGDSAVKYSGYGYRGFCMNQYHLEKSLGSTSIVHRANAEQKIGDFVNGLEFKIGDLDAHMKIARSIGLPVKEVAAWVSEMYIAKTVSPIVTQYEADGDLTLLGLYNAITNVMTRRAEAGLIDADGLINNLRDAESMIRVEEGEADVWKEWFAESLVKQNEAAARVVA